MKFKKADYLNSQVLKVNTKKNKLILDLSMSESKSFNLILFGDSGVGKATFINRLLTGEYTNKQLVAQGESQNLTFNTTFGLINFKILECTLSKETTLDGLESIIKNMDCCIIMHDQTNEVAEKVELLNKAIMKKLNFPTLVIYSKNDLCNFNQQSHIKHLMNYDSYFISKDIYQVDTPFIYLTKKLLCVRDLFLFERNLTFKKSIQQTHSEKEQSVSISAIPTDSITNATEKMSEELLIEFEKTKQQVEKTKQLQELKTIIAKLVDSGYSEEKIESISELIAQFK